MATTPKRWRVDIRDLYTFLLLLSESKTQVLSQRKLGKHMIRSTSTITRLLYVCRNIFDMEIEANDSGGYVIKDWGVFNEKKLKKKANERWN